MIDLNKIDLLIKGQAEPDDLGEEMFLRAYQDGLKGTLLFVFLTEIDEILEKLNGHEKDMLMLGYAMGQHDLETVEFTLNSDTKIH